MKTQNKQKKKENKWRTGTLILIGLIGILLISGVYLAQKESDNNRLDFREKICQEIKYTPSWAMNPQGVFDYGYKRLKEGAVDVLVDNGIYFIYNSNCGACHKQIEDFGDDWEKYVESGYTINCAEDKK